VASLGYADLHRFGIERRRAETMLRVCRRAAVLDALAWHSSAAGPGAGSARLRATLLAVPGLGPWTAAVVAQQALGDPDAVIIGDYHLPHVVAWHLAGQRRATDARMLELLEPYRGQRARVVRLLGLAGRPARRAPKRRLRSIAAR
jgi:3-methyladenine DNA glycosylase/8-oxoguanine DNA glycosylase